MQSFVLIALMWFSAGINTGDFLVKRNTVSFSINQSSEIYLEGTSNINSFTCVCKHNFERQRVTFETINGGDKVVFEKSLLAFRGRSLDCGHKKMNKDMYRTLQVERYPEIKVELLQVEHMQDRMLTQCEDWLDLSAEALITIADRSVPKHMVVRAKNNGDGTYAFRNSTSVRLSDFQIDPPTAMLGLIKVDDEINLHFDLVISVDQP